MIKTENEIKSCIDGLISSKQRVVTAVDGNCAAGKTTFACRLSELYDCNVFHMDDFFLRPEQRTKERLEQPGGNVDYERFLEEVLKPICKKEAVYYRRYDCKTQRVLNAVRIEQRQLNIVEGSYSLHPELYGYYDLRIFMLLSPDEQMRRITERNGKEGAFAFAAKWIPLENKYFEAFSIKECCDCVIEV